VGGLDGVSLCGSEATLAAVSGLLAEPDALPVGVTFLAVPWAAPDGLVSAALGTPTSGANARAFDEDCDGLEDEDGPDDLDGDGLVLDMLVEDPAGPWTRSPDPRFLAPAREGDAPRYRLLREGKDDDGDGLFNEDGPGGVRLDRNFPVGWRGPWDGELGGELPLSEPSSRTLAELVLTRRVAAALLLQGNHGSLAHPGGLAAEEFGFALPAPRHASLYADLTSRYLRAASRPAEPARSVAGPGGGARRGAAIDWLYAAGGAVAFELAVWGPSVDAPAESAVDAAYTPNGEAPERERLDDRARAWRAWLDNTRGGLGFVDWHPVDLGNGPSALVGGWEPRTRLNPPEDTLERAVEGLVPFVRDLAAGVARLEVEVLRRERDGELVRLAARVVNRGVLPSGVSPGETARAGGVRLELRLPTGARRLAGPGSVALGHLPGGGSSEVVEWLVLAPQGRTLVVTAEDALTLPARAEVSP
jgi:hypothetical protein